jgi:hypothetical protein
MLKLNTGGQQEGVSQRRRTGGVAQGAEHLLCKCKALSSNPSPQIKKQTNWCFAHREGKVGALSSGRSTFILQLLIWQAQF